MKRIKRFYIFLGISTVIAVVTVAVAFVGMGVLAVFFILVIGGYNGIFVNAFLKIGIFMFLIFGNYFGVQFVKNKILSLSINSFFIAGIAGLEFLIFQLFFLGNTLLPFKIIETIIVFVSTLFWLRGYKSVKLLKKLVILK